MLSVWFVSPAWRRFDVTRLVLAQRKHCCDELGKRGLEARSVIVADDENLDIAAEYGADAVEHANVPLGRKCNAGLRYACEQGADFVVYVGSDDWVHPDAFDPLPRERPKTRRTPVILSGRTLAVVDLERGVMQQVAAPGRNGVIPWVIPREALTACGYEPIRPTLRRGLDGSLVRGLRSKPVWAFHDPHPLCRVDFKTRENLTPYRALRSLRRGREVTPWDALAERYPADLVEMARSTHLKGAAGG